MKAGRVKQNAGRKAPLQIVIRRDGQVVFRTFTDEMLSVAAQLAPDDPTVRKRLRQRDTLRKRGAHDQEPDN